MKSLLTNLLPLGIAALLWRTAQWLSPSIGMTVVGIFLLATLTIFYVKQMPMLRQTLKWAWLILIGGCLNFAAILANGGVMPISIVTSPPRLIGLYWWVWLGDWIGGVTSPGDILMFIGFFGIVATLLIRHRQHKLAEQT